MADTHEALLKSIRQYQESLEKYTRHRNDGKLVHYMDKLFKLPIRLVHLEETGVGRTVNGLRKMGREVGDCAKALVAKWKEMVMAEQRLRSEEEDGYESGNDQDASEPSDTDPEDEEVEEEEEVVVPIHNDSSSRNESDNERVEPSSSSVHTNRQSSPHSKKDKHKHHRSSNGEASSSKSKVVKRKVESDSEEEEPQHKKRTIIEDSSDDETEEVSKKHKRKIESDEEDKVSREKKRSSMEHERKEHKSKRKSESHSHKSSRGSRERSKGDRKDKEKESKHKSDEKKEESRKHGHSSEKKHKKSSSSSTSKSSKEEPRKSDSKKDKSDEKTPKPKRDSYVKPQGIDSGSGASFAEALGMCEPSSSKTQKKKPTQPDRKEKTSKIEDLIPETLKESPPEPLDINIASLLPSITPHYRPLGNLISEEVHLKRPLTDYEQLSNIITSKNQRTKVYSGNKVGCGKVSALFELCIRVLQDNIDALEYTGGVPYLVLKPILEKSTPNQLFLLEHHNPYLIEDTDELWQLHSQKEFRNKKREELESWREMYMRCLDEREAKLKALTANIKQSQDKSIPVRTTKLAYVDDVAKPPRNIARKQAKNGTAFDKKPAMTPSARLSSLATSGEAGKVAVPNPGARAAERSHSHSHIAKPKKAPLMAKSLSLLKNRFKR